MNYKPIYNAIEELTKAAPSATRMESFINWLRIFIESDFEDGCQPGCVELWGMHILERQELLRLPNYKTSSGGLGIDIKTPYPNRIISLYNRIQFVQQKLSLL